MGLALQGILGLIELVCFILVIMAMFQNGQTGLGVACLVGLILCGVGLLVGFVYGWIKATEWKLNNIMLVWTGCIVVHLILSFVFPVQLPFALPAR
jgi:hypothetical protein